MKRQQAYHHVSGHLPSGSDYPDGTSWLAAAPQGLTGVRCRRDAWMPTIERFWLARSGTIMHGEERHKVSHRQIAAAPEVSQRASLP